MHAQGRGIPGGHFTKMTYSQCGMLQCVVVDYDDRTRPFLCKDVAAGETTASAVFGLDDEKARGRD
jgi:hypothetical protein